MRMHGTGATMDTQAQAERLPSLGYRIYVLFVLALIGMMATFDRQILNILIEPIRKEFLLSDTSVGALKDLAFSVTYVVAAIPVARIADRTSKRNIIVFAVTTWSVMTILCGLARNFGLLFAARVGVGIGEAGGYAPAQALLSDMFPQRQRARVVSIYLVGGTVGMGLGLFLGGWAMHELGWRQVFLLAGIPGLILGPLAFFTIRDVRKGLADGVTRAVEHRPLLPTLRTLWGIKTLPLLVAAAMIQALLSQGINGWMPAFLMRSHHLSPTVVGAYLGIALMVGSIAGHLLGGVLADWLGRWDLRAHLWIGVVGSLLAACFSAVALFGPVQYVFVLLAGQILVSGLSAAPLLAITTTLAPVWARTTATACLLICINLVGLGVGSALIGPLSDVLRPAYGEESLRYALLCSLVLVIPAATFFYLAGRHYRADFAAAGERLAEDSATD